MIGYRKQKYSKIMMRKDSSKQINWWERKILSDAMNFNVMSLPISDNYKF